MDERIRLSSTDSVNSVNTNKYLDIGIQRHTKIFPLSSINETIDQYKVFVEERNKCNKYRLILTIKPYCTNVLFNVVTEIVNKEGTDNKNELLWFNDDDKTFSKTGNENIIGKKYNVKRNEMVKNTEYSKLDRITYHCGYDIFNNHILRNKTFKMVNQMKSGQTNDDFNTISDYMRFADGGDAKFITRKSIKNITTNNKRHLYIYDDLYSYTDCINARLMEDNGWYGFTNLSTIPTKEKKSNGIWEDMNISRVINDSNSGNCTFTDMYPDRTLFSFTPKYNDLQHREEYNWDVCLTYPYSNWDNHKILRDGDLNALLIEDWRKAIDNSGEKCIIFKTFFKHNLSKGSTVRLYFFLDSRFQDAGTFDVSNVGDLSGSNKDVYFVIKNYTVFLEKSMLSDEQDFANNFEIRFVRVVNGNNSKYYIRKFRKIPNLRKKKEELTSSVVKTNETYEEYVTKNARIEENDNSPMLPFIRETYPLAFSQTIYGDGCTQLTFTDGIDITNLVDNLGRPLTDIYITIVKSNRGYKEFYNEEFTKAKDIEYSHCFGKLTAGLKFKHKDTAFNTDLYKYAENSDVEMINDLDCFNAIPLEDDIEKHSSARNITIDDDEFFGDLVEYNSYEAIENILTDVCFRFNTAQRELSDESTALSKFEFKYQEIESDDFDLEGFKIMDFFADNDNLGLQIGGVTLSSLQRPEGYYYKPHYKINVRQFGEIKQDSHIEIRVSKAKPVQLDNMYVQLTTSIPHLLVPDDRVFVCNDSTDTWYETSVVNVVDRLNVVISPIKEINWYKLCNILNKEENETLKIRKVNPLIPDYATKADGNNFIWRDVLRVGDTNATNLIEYPFTNGYFYIDTSINFFLRRQDPFGKNGLYAGDLYPNDVYGNPLAALDNYYEEVTETTC